MRHLLASVMCGAIALLVGIGPARAQDQTVTLDIRDATLADAIKILGQETGIQFILGPDVDPDTRVTMSVEDKPVERVLDLLLQVAGNLTAEKVEGVYIIRGAGAGAPAGGGMTPTTPTRPGS